MRLITEQLATEKKMSFLYPSGRLTAATRTLDEVRAHAEVQRALVKQTEANQEQVGY